MTKTAKSKLTVHTRWMIQRDMPDVMSIEQRCFSEPWNEEQIKLLLQERSNVGMVAELNGDVVAHAIYRLKKGSLTLLNFAVDPGYHRRGIGKQFMEKIMGKLCFAHRPLMKFEIREDNMAGLKFFQRLGFLATSISRESCSNGMDSYHMEYRL